MKVLVSSDETGTIKEVICPRGTDTSKKDGIKPSNIEKVCLDLSPSLKSRVKHMIVLDEHLITLRLDGVVCIYNLNYELIKSHTLHNTTPISLLGLEQHSAFVAAFEDGTIFIATIDHDPVKISLNSNPIATFVENPYKDGEFAFGGEENDIKLVNLYEKPSKKFMSTKFNPTVVFGAENVPNDFLDLRVPVSVKHIRFIEETKFISVTKYGQMRMYDTSAKTAPIHDFKIGPKPIIQVALYKDNAILSDTTNLIGKYSLTKIDQNATKINSASAGQLTRPSVRLLGKFNEGGNVGATHAIFNYNDNIIATGGLDRYLRVFDAESRKLVAKVYVGTQISSIIILSDDETANEVVKLTKKKRVVVDDEEADDMWNELEKADQPKKLKKKSRKI